MISLESELLTLTTHSIYKQGDKPMESSNIHISDCVDNETFEALVEMAELSRFDDLGDPKDEAEELEKI